MMSSGRGFRAARRPRSSAALASRRDYHHGNLHRALLDAALDLTRRRGPGTFTLADLCRTVGVSPAAPYRHVESLDQLIAEAAREGFEQLDLVTQKSFRGADWLERLASCTADYLHFIRTHPAHAVVMFETRSQTVAEPDFNPTRPLKLPVGRNATEKMVYSCWEAGMASFHLYAQGLAAAMKGSPLEPAFATRTRAIETALALFTMLQGIAYQWLGRALPDEWLDRGAKKAFENIIRPWALGIARQYNTGDG